MCDNYNLYDTAFAICGNGVLKCAESQGAAAWTIIVLEFGIIIKTIKIDDKLLSKYICSDIRTSQCDFIDDKLIINKKTDAGYWIYDFEMNI